MLHLSFPLFLTTTSGEFRGGALPAPPPPPTPRTKISSISWVFFRKCINILDRPKGVGAPAYDKSWIRPRPPFTQYTVRSIHPSWEKLIGYFTKLQDVGLKEVLISLRTVTRFNLGVRPPRILSMGVSCLWRVYPCAVRGSNHVLSGGVTMYCSGCIPVLLGGTPAPPRPQQARPVKGLPVSPSNSGNIAFPSHSLCVTFHSRQNKQTIKHHHKHYCVNET